VSIGWNLDLEALDHHAATFVHRNPQLVTPDPHALTVTIPRSDWETLGRPGKVDVTVEVTP
jgi:hypothetical protein